MWQGSVEDRGFAVIPEVLELGDVAGLLEDLTQVTAHRSRAGVRHALQHASVAAMAQGIKTSWELAHLIRRLGYAIGG